MAEVSAPGAEEPPGERPKWSFTWLLRIQRTGRNRVVPANGEESSRSMWSRLFPWAVILLLLLEVGLLVWLGVLPR